MHAGGALMLTLWCFTAAANSPTKTIGSVSRQYFTFTAVDFYNHKLEAVEKESGWKVTQMEEFIFSVAVDFILQAIAICICKIIIHHSTSLNDWHK